MKFFLPYFASPSGAKERMPWSLQRIWPGEHANPPATETTVWSMLRGRREPIQPTRTIRFARCPALGASTPSTAGPGCGTAWAGRRPARQSPASKGRTSAAARSKRFVARRQEQAVGSGSRPAAPSGPSAEGTRIPLPVRRSESLGQGHRHRAQVPANWSPRSRSSAAEQTPVPPAAFLNSQGTVRNEGLHSLLPQEQGKLLRPWIGCRRTPAASRLRCSKRMILAALASEPT